MCSLAVIRKPAASDCKDTGSRSQVDRSCNISEYPVDKKELVWSEPSAHERRHACSMAVHRMVS